MEGRDVLHVIFFLLWFLESLVILCVMNWWLFLLEGVPVILGLAIYMISLCAIQKILLSLLESWESIIISVV